jgi:hypothetical protein
MRCSLVLVLVGGCLWEFHPIEQAQTFDAQLTYDGEIAGATVAFPSYTRSEHPDTIGGTVTGISPITNAWIELENGERTYVIEVARKPGDDASTGPIACELADEDIGHATACKRTNRSCSIVLMERP